jgi:hypothetical protein
MPIALNEDVAGRLDEVGCILAEQGANRFRVQAHHQGGGGLARAGATGVRIFSEEGPRDWRGFPAWASIARSIRDILQRGKLAMLDRLRGEHDPRRC